MQDLEKIITNLAHLLEDSKAENVVALDVSNLNSWTNYFIIATAQSSSQMSGLKNTIETFIKEQGREYNLEIYKPKNKISDGDDWVLVDIGSIIVHIMSKEAREFYQLEELWHEAKKIL